ncbi:MAG TPA: HEAT repeat domain-containing protein [Armatimonadota bacterium]|jgi:HEAT repeat protein
MDDVEEWILRLQDGDWQVHRRATDALRATGPAALEPLCRLLKGGDERAREAAARTLGEIGDPGAAGALRAALRDEDASVRQAAAESLGGMGSDSTGALCEALADGASGVRRAAVQSLLKLADPQAADALCKALRDADWWVCGTAKAALVNLGAPAVGPLCRLLQQGSEEERYAAIEVLEALAFASPTPRLREALPVLRRLARGAKRGSPMLLSLERIQAALEETRSLPVPATLPAPVTPSLPIPSPAPPPPDA